MRFKADPRRCFFSCVERTPTRQLPKRRLRRRDASFFYDGTTFSAIGFIRFSPITPIVIDNGSSVFRIGFISAASYLGLIYLVLIFCYKSILRRGENMYCDERDESYLVGEEEAIWLLRLLLPYLNELLFKMRVVFSGDPATTMKLAVLLFVMARCGSSITIWTLSKLSKSSEFGFMSHQIPFLVFTIQ